MKPSLVLTFALLGNLALAQPLYRDASASIESRIQDLVTRMTMEEKILQLNQYTFGENRNPNNYGQEVTNIDPMRDLSYPDGNGTRFLEAGEFYVHVGDQKLRLELCN